MSPTTILCIDDLRGELDPFIVALRLKYGRGNVILEQNPQKGLDFIMQRLTQKLIVLLDLDLGTGQIPGAELFKEIREKSSLVYVIIITSQEFSRIPAADLVEIINNHALAIVNNTDSIADRLIVVDRAVHELDVRVDCVLEQWIANRPDDNQPYILTSTGKSYTLKEVLVEIRKRTTLGMQLEKGILQLAIELLTTQEKKIDD